MNIYIGNISYETSEEDLRTAFGAYGEVDSAKIITNRDTGRSKGFAFVEMPDQGNGEAAVEGLNGQDMGGRALRVNEARPRESR